MAHDPTDALFDQFVTEYGQGRDPDVRDYLHRAGEKRAELGSLIDAYLAIAPIAGTDEETAILVNAHIAGHSPVVELRERRALDIGAVVQSLQDKLAIAPALAKRLREAYEDLERDWLDPSGVHSSVWTALREVFAFDVEKLVGHERPAMVQGALLRRDEGATLAAPTAPEHEPTPPDDIDRLFRGRGQAPTP